MKKIIKSILLLAAITTGMVSFVSCSDDDDLTTADALFRPIISEDLKEMDPRIFREEKMGLKV